MKVFRILGAIGFLFSAIAAGLGASISLAAGGLFAWGISLPFRSIAWILLARNTGKRLYLMTGFLVLILGFLSIYFIGSFISKSDGIILRIGIVLWSVYSFFEFLSYLITKGIFFKIAMINLVSIIGWNIGFSVNI